MSKRKISENSPGVNWEEFKYRPNKHDSAIPAPVETLGYLGRRLRHMLLDAILVGTPVVLAIQKRRSPKWTVFMKAASLLGREDFYTILFVLLLWIFDSRFARLFVLLMGVGFYVTGFLKTFLCLPRPPLPPVRPLEKAYDWALPSHHCVLGTILPWYIWMYINIHYTFSTLQLGFCFMIIFLWSFNVLVSRLYLGVHSPADVVTGGIVGMVILFSYVAIDDAIDHYISQQLPEVPIQVAVLLTFLVVIHPAGDPGNPSLRDSCILVGVILGVVFGHSQRLHVIGHLALLETLPPDTAITSILTKSFFRILLGAIFTVLVRTFLKTTLYMFYPAFFKTFGVAYYSGKYFRKQGQVPMKHYSSDFKITPLESETVKEKELKPDCNLQANNFSTNIILSDEDGNNIKKSEWKIKFDEISALWQTKISNANFFDFYLPFVPLDVDVFVTLTLYPILTYCVFEYLPRLFLLCNV